MFYNHKAMAIKIANKNKSLSLNPKTEYIENEIQINYYIKIPTLLVSSPLLLKQVPRQQEDRLKHKGSL